jgi:hypothetical protein
MIEFLTDFVLWFTTSIRSWCTHIQNNITPATFQHCIWYLVTNKMYPMNCFVYFPMYKLPRPELMIFILFSTESSTILCSFSVSLHLAFCDPTKSNLYHDISLAVLVSDQDVCRLLKLHKADFHFLLLTPFRKVFSEAVSYVT